MPNNRIKADKLITTILLAACVLFGNVAPAYANSDSSSRHAKTYKSIQPGDRTKGKRFSSNNDKGIIAEIVEKLAGMWSKVTLGMLEDTEGDVTIEIKDSVAQSLNLFYYFSSNGVAGINNGILVEPVYKAWRSTLIVSSVIFPLVVVLNYVFVQAQGYSAGLARSEKFKLLFRSVIVIILTGTSNQWVHYIIRIGWGMGEYIASFGIANGGDLVVGVFAGAVASGIGFFFGIFPGLIGMFFTLVYLIILFMLVSALALSYFALIVIALVLLVASPLVIIFGEIPQFKWVYSMWMKGLGGIMIIPVFNALILRLWYEVPAITNGGGFIGHILRLGFIGILVSLNYKMGQLVFGPIMEATSKAMDATKMIGTALAGIAEIAAGGGGLSGLASGIKGKAGNGGGGGGSTGSVLSSDSGGNEIGGRNSSGKPKSWNEQTQGSVYKSIGGARRALKQAGNGTISARDAQSLAKSKEFAKAIIGRDPVLNAGFRNAFKTIDNAVVEGGNSTETKNHVQPIKSNINEKPIVDSILGEGFKRNQNKDIVNVTMPKITHSLGRLEQIQKSYGEKIFSDNLELGGGFNGASLAGSIIAFDIGDFASYKSPNGLMTKTLAKNNLQRFVAERNLEFKPLADVIHSALTSHQAAESKTPLINHIINTLQAKINGE